MAQKQNRISLDRTKLLGFRLDVAAFAAAPVQAWRQDRGQDRKQDGYENTGPPWRQNWHQVWR